MGAKKGESIFDVKEKISFKGRKDLSQRIDEIVYDEEVLVGVAKDIDKQVKTGKMKTVSEKEMRKKL